MNITELRNQLDNFYQNGVGAVAYFVLKKDNEMHVRMVDIKNEFLDDLRDQYLSNIRETIIDTSTSEGEALQIVNISVADERKNVLYEYDLEETPNELNVLSEVLSNGEQPMYSSRNDDTKNLYAYIIAIGDAQNKMLLYKKHYPISKFSAQKHFFIFESDHRFVRMENDMIRLDHKFDIMSINGVLLINNLKMLESFFGFHDIIKREAMASITAIEAEGIIDNPTVLSNMLDDVSFARKLTKTATNSPVLGKIPVPSIIEFTKNHPALKDKLNYSTDNTKIHLDTQKSKRLFLKLLNDDYLRSELTQAYYDSLAKDTLNVEG